MRQFLALFLAIAMTWQGVQASWGCLACSTDAAGAATVLAAAGQGDDLASADPADDTDRGTCADHLQHHATAMLHELMFLRFGWPPSQPLAMAPDSMASAATPTPLRPPRTIPSIAV